VTAQHPDAPAASHKLWGGRFGGGPAPELDAVNRSIGVDFRLWPFDIQLSQAWAKALGRASQEGGYDVVICDPPKLSPTRGAKEGALGVYKALAAAGCRATKPGGIFVLCSCSSAVSLDDLTRAVALGARESRMHAVVFDRHFQGADHPVSAAFPEGLYLKSVIVRLEAL
jgi:hypothetical protein